MCSTVNAFEDRRGIIEDPEDQLRYVLSGQGKFTLVSKATGNRFTYKTKKIRKGAFIFVLTGPDNEADYDSYAGALFADSTTFRAAPALDTPPSGRAIEWWADSLRTHNYEALSQVEFWHEGHCGRCGKLLTTPESIARGLGPVCATKAR